MLALGVQICKLFRHTATPKCAFPDLSLSLSKERFQWSEVLFLVPGHPSGPLLPDKSSAMHMDWQASARHLTSSCRDRWFSKLFCFSGPSPSPPNPEEPRSHCGIFPGGSGVLGDQSTVRRGQLGRSREGPRLLCWGCQHQLRPLCLLGSSSQPRALVSLFPSGNVITALGIN